MKAIFTLFIVVVFVGCATATPKELINARAAYQHASQGPAAELTPAQLHQAYTALAKAEKAFEEDPDSYRTLDLAYVAQRKAELAAALAAIAANKTSRGTSNAAYDAEQAAIAKQAQQDLLDAEKRAAEARAASATDKAAQDLRASEQRTAEALAKLAKLAAVKEDERGLIIILSGNVLFKSNQSSLLPAAKAKLDQVGDALRLVPGRTLIVEGYTDSMGTAAYNQDLSKRRADTVRDYLIHDGFPSTRIRSIGMGQNNPIADNSTAEGRANNRRVEIIIERLPQASN